MKLYMLGFWVLSLLIGGCATKFHLETQPNAIEVFAGDKSLGKTPLDFTASDVPDTYRMAKGVLLRLQDKGYKNLWIWLPAESRHYDVTLNLNPMYRRAAQTSRRESQGEIDFSRSDLNRLSDQLLQIQQNLLIGTTADDKSLNALFEANPTLGSVYFLKALQALRANQSKESDLLLKDAMRFSPEEYDFLALYNELVRKGAK